MPEQLYLKSYRAEDKRLREIAPQYFEAFEKFDDTVMADGALSKKLKELVAVAVAHTTQCPYYIDFHVKEAKKAGASARELVEAIWVAAALRAGAAFAHSRLALTSFHEQ